MPFTFTVVLWIVTDGHEVFKVSTSEQEAVGFATAINSLALHGGQRVNVEQIEGVCSHVKPSRLQS